MRYLALLALTLLSSYDVQAIVNHTAVRRGLSFSRGADNFFAGTDTNADGLLDEEERL